jgi:energy-coupling factor transport system permease protein
MLITYLPADSFLYRINPMFKGLAALFMIVAFSLGVSGVLKLFLLLITMLLLAMIGKVSLKPVIYSLRKIFLLLAIVALVQGFSRGEFSTVLAVEAVLRIIGVFFTAGIFVTVSSQSELMFFWEQCFRPFQLIGLPARELALVMVIAVRFLPVILAEIDRIRMAQIARGASLKSKSGFCAIRTLLPLLIPTLTLALRRAEELAVAMEARGYSLSKNRTRFRSFYPGIMDFFFFALLTAFLVALHMAPVGKI